ncbi:MAG: Mu transposase C-terminal domain-containing protein [Lachnospiraceae bacterium]|nr:Mu transposase C-terminal domain-containing protein [Lachnospiraceae bacterium]MDE6251131.1 Mu transposase C-terminal domain-containing protein [Lachnospiraceae bacterium]
MVEEYVTLNEAAELENIKYNTMVQKLKRYPEKFNITKEQREGGGRELTMVAVSSLSKKARTAWKERQRLKEVEKTQTQDTSEMVGTPWYVDEDIDWFIEKHNDEWYKAMEIGNIVREFMEYDEKGRTEYAETFAQERLGKGKRTLYRYVKSYLEAEAWADKLHKKDGGNYEFFKVLCLCRKPKEAGTFPSFTPEVRQAIKNIWFNRQFAQNQGTKEMLYDKLTAIKDANEWDRIPSYKSVVRYINYLMEDEHMRNAWYLASRGEREYRNKIMVKGERNTKDLKVMQVVMGDEHTFDCWVAYTLPNGRVTAVKPHLAAWVDIKSRMILGDVMCKDANSDILKQSLLKLLYHDAGSVPQYIYIDNGKDYTSKGMTGYNRNDRQRLEFDDTAKGFYKSIGIEDYHRSLPYYAWTKAQIERFFETVCNQFTKWFTSYTGTLTGSKTFAKVDKDIKGMLERGELFTMEEFYEKWTEWLHTVYMVKLHSGLKKQGEEFTTPKSCFENAEKYEKALPPKSYATLLMMKSERCFVRNTGIRLGGLSYRSDDLCAYINGYVDVKYDPHDMKTIYVFENGKQVCEAYAQELLVFASEHGVEQKALKEHLSRQKKQLKNDRKIVEEANVPFTEINDQYVGFNEVTGGIDLMIGKKPEKKAGKVISLPNDNTYRNGFRAVKNEEPEEENEYINKKAEEALKALRAL